MPLDSSVTQNAKPSSYTSWPFTRVSSCNGSSCNLWSWPRPGHIFPQESHPEQAREGTSARARHLEDLPPVLTHGLCRTREREFSTPQTGALRTIGEGSRKSFGLGLCAVTSGLSIPRKGDR